jgi:hypothetical protein
MNGEHQFWRGRDDWDRPQEFQILGKEVVWSTLRKFASSRRVKLSSPIGNPKVRGFDSTLSLLARTVPLIRHRGLTRLGLTS